jgi:hypothetical protein
MRWAYFYYWRANNIIVKWVGVGLPIIPAVIALYLIMKVMSMMRTLAKYPRKEMRTLIYCTIVGWAVGMGVRDTPFNVMTQGLIVEVL